MRTGLICITLFLLLFTVVSFAANTSYTIKQGDTLYDIAKRHNTSVSKIKQLNNFESNNLKIGSSILIPSNIVTYKIKSGDTLGSVAQKYGLSSSKEIIDFNGLDSSFVRVGQTIRIPSTATSKPVAAKPATVPTKNIVVKKEKKILNSSYTVTGGDSLYSIAIKHGTTVDSIKELNNLENNNLKIGQELRITKQAPAQKAVAKKTVIEKEVVKEVVVQETGPTNIYKVKSGDTISQIAEMHGVLTKDLKAHNNLESNNLKIGQLLTIPSATHSIVIVEKPKSFDPEIKPVEVKPVTVAKSTGIKLPAAVKPEQPKEQLSFPVNSEPVVQVVDVGPEPEDRYHVVEAGDTLGHIAVKYNLESSKTIIEANDLGKTNLKIGQKLLIPSDNTTVVAKSKIVTPAVSNQKNKKIPKPAVEKKIHTDTYTGSYRVRSGDTVSQIAEKFDIKTSDLKRANKLKNNNIRVGQKLSVPRTTSNLVTKSSKKDQVYIVRKGDTLNAIANKFNVKVKTLKKYNNLKTSRLDIGDRIRVPDSSLIVTKSGDIQYKVVKGDSLLKIANNFNVSVRSLKSANGLNSNNIHVGDKLIIPPTSTIKRSSGTSVAKSSKKSKNATIINYRVRGGDTLSSIARKHNSSVTKIKQANNLMGNSIYSGQKLKVPSKLYASTSKKSTKKKKSFTNEAELKDELINVAKRYLGAPYKFGGTSTKTGIDCSAYVNKVFKSFDVNLPRTARGIYKKGNHVSKSKLQKGDLVFFRTYAKFPSHVGIYMGDGTFIHASSAKKKVIITNFQGKYYQKRYIGAKRIKIKDSYAKNLNK